MALATKGWKQTNAELAMIERGVLSSKGQLSSLMSGRRGTKAVNIEMLGGIADFFEVDFEWLCLGRGEMRRVPMTPFEEALAAARTLGVREDVMLAAQATMGAAGERMTKPQWMDAFVAAARAAAAQAPPLRPEEATQAKLDIRRKGSQKRRLADDGGGSEDVDIDHDPKPAGRRASGHR